MSGIINWRGHDWLALPIRWYLGIVFIYACLHKIAHPGSFALDIATYDILPLALVNPMAIILPYIELAAGVMLIVGFRTRGAALLVFGMMLVFTIALCIALAKGIDTSCGCFASQSLEEDPIGAQTIVRDLSWLTMSLYVLLFDARPLGLERWLEGRKAPAAHARR
jgi:putative oxidoreductase